MHEQQRGACVEGGQWKDRQGWIKCLIKGAWSYASNAKFAITFTLAKVTKLNTPTGLFGAKTPTQTES